MKGSLQTSEHLKNNVSSEDGKLVLDLIEAIHAAEKKQAESDASLFAEEKRILKVCFVARTLNCWLETKIA